MQNNKIKKDIPEPERYPHTTKKEGKERESLRWMGYGIELVGVMGIFTFAGYWADERLGTSPWLMTAGMMVAFVGMIYLLWKETADWRK